MCLNYCNYHYAGCDNVQFHQLLYLKTVSKTKSIRKASNQLHVSQQAISQALQKLEEEYNIQLLNRSVHGITFTEAGKHAVTVANQILTLSTDLEQYFFEQAEKKCTGMLRISAICSIKDYILPEIQIRFLKQNPYVQLSIHSMGTEQVINAIMYKEYDIGLFGNPYINDVPLFHIKPPLHFVALSRYEYCVNISKNSRLNNYNTLSVKSILQYPIIFLQDQLQNRLEDYMPYRLLSQFGVVDALIADSIKFMGKLIEADMGIAISTDGIFAEDIIDAQVVTKPLRDNVYGYLGYLIHEDTMDSPLATQFLDILLNEY